MLIEDDVDEMKVQKPNNFEGKQPNNLVVSCEQRRRGTVERAS